MKKDWQGRNGELPKNKKESKSRDGANALSFFCKKDGAERHRRLPRDTKNRETAKRKDKNRNKKPPSAIY